MILQIRAKHVLVAAVLSVLLLSLNVPAGLGSQASTIALSSQGMVNYEKNELWWGVCVSETCWGDLRYTPSGYGSFFSKHQIDLIANAGANYVRLQINLEPWNSGDDTNVYGIPYKDYIKQLVQEMHEVGLYVRVELAQYGCSGTLNSVMDGKTKIQMVLDTHPLISSQDWIDWGIDVLQHIPEVDMICNIDEPGSTSSMVAEGAPNFPDDWRAFCIRCIEAWRAVKPDVAVCVMGAPFYYLNQFFDPPYQLVTEGVTITGRGPLPYENIYYGFHRPYYTGWGSTVDEYYYNGDFATAKSLLYSTLNTKMKPLIDKGEDVILTMSVVHGDRSRDDPYKPANWQYIMKDCYEWCLANGVHQEQYGMTTNPWNILQSRATGYSGEQYIDWNEVGQFWADNVP